MVTEQFQEKNKTRVCKDDALSKRHMHTKMKVTDPVKNEEPLQKQRLYKMEYRKKMKAKSIESQEPSASTSTGAEEGFSQRSTLMQSLWKAENPAKKSPKTKKLL